MWAGHWCCVSSDGRRPMPLSTGSITNRVCQKKLLSITAVIARRAKPDEAISWNRVSNHRICQEIATACGLAMTW